MAKKPEAPKPIVWGIYKIAAKASTSCRISGNWPVVWLGTVEAPDEAAAIEKGAAEFKAPATRLMAIRR